MSKGWIRCSKHKPCPICGRPDWCGLTEDGVVAHCMRLESDHPCAKGGWIHFLQDRPKDYRPARDHARAPAPCVGHFAGMMAEYQRRTPCQELDRHAADLGLTTNSLLRLGIGWSGPHRAWAFPMKDGDGKTIGIRLRAENGEKWAISGTRQGVFVPLGEPIDGEPVLACEGPTDTAAMLDMGFFALGRPSCLGCEDILAKMLKGLDVIIVGDRDTPKLRPDGTSWLPGRDGAEKLARALFLGRARSVKIIYPLKGCKDARAWLQAGATKDLVMMAARERMPWRPKEKA